MDKLCLHKIRPDKLDQAIGPELQNALLYMNMHFLKQRLETRVMGLDAKLKF
jgi:hypothetical protein